MDLIAIDVCDQPSPGWGDLAELFGAHAPVDRAAPTSGMIACEAPYRPRGRAGRSGGA